MLARYEPTYKISLRAHRLRGFDRRLTSMKPQEPRCILLPLRCRPDPYGDLDPMGHFVDVIAESRWTWGDSFDSRRHIVLSYILSLSTLRWLIILSSKRWGHRPSGGCRSPKVSSRSNAGYLDLETLEQSTENDRGPAEHRRLSCLNSEGHNRSVIGI